MRLLALLQLFLGLGAVKALTPTQPWLATSLGLVTLALFCFAFLRHAKD